MRGSVGATAVAVVLMLVMLLFATAVRAQRGGRGGTEQGPPPTGRAAAPIDLAGYWVSLVTDDWRWRMMTPPKGDYLYLPLNAEGRRVADTWDPAKDESAGTQCKGYGAPSIMHLPGRLHVTWENENSLKIDVDTGTQTRVFHFGAAQPPAGDAGWQGYSVAQWELAGGRGGRGRGRGAAAPVGQPRPGSSLKAVTTHLRPGYFRKNGIPYSENAVLTEYYTTITDTGVDYLLVTNFLEDPQYLAQPYVRTVQYKKQADAKGWNPTACSAR